MHARHASSGFSLREMLIAMAIVALMMGLAVPLLT
jgi:prepilin-type N-terminal cleavage/methylation domain-containing protein